MRFARLLSGLFLGLCACAASAATPSLIPLPARVETAAGRFAYAAGRALPLAAPDPRARAAARFLREQLAAAGGPALRPVGSASAPGGVTLAIDPNAPAAAESYVLDVGPRGVRVAARDGAGLFRGVATLWQLFTDPADAGALPALHVEDAPRFAWRGLMLDSVRHMQSVADIERLLDQMALHKLNVLHWHLTDDQGWRIPIRRYPELTRIGAWRTPPGAGSDDEPQRYGGYYTQEQIRALVRYAAARRITVVPELDLPGHAQAAVASYPQVGVTGRRLPVSADWGVNTTLYNVDESTVRFLQNVLDEVMALFPSRYIHLGGDEAVKDQWQASPAVQARLKALGLKDEDALQSWLMDRLGRYLARHGRRMVGWDEILDGGVPGDAVVMSWRGTQGAEKAARLGHDVVLSPAPELYLDYLQSAREDEQTGRVPVRTLADVYAFEPVPKSLDAAQAAHVLGVQANMWTEHTPTMAHVEHAVFPRLDALAEVAWTPAAERDFHGFLARLPAQLARYRRAGIRYADSAFAPDIAVDEKAALASGSAPVTLSNQAGYGTLRYTVDGSAPGADAPRYEHPFTVRLPATVRAVALDGDGRPLAEPRARAIDRAALLARDGTALVNCPGSPFRLRVQPMPDATTLAPVYVVNLFNACQQWPEAPLDGVTAVRFDLARLPDNYQLAHEAKLVVRRPPATPHGELEIRLDRCDGPPLATLPLPDPAATPRRFSLAAPLPAQRGAHTLCLAFATPAGSPLYAFARVTLQAGAP
ncbi:family 20 glycosylhydrolase [Fulvimonas soli]|uniref:beta-N-acetylhexosaminidase n=1 Tax=Fulvimonas soli TaxID=155197 RepID=A0A316HM89_9GAMM|nr:family 20 glycosylhydrolase [Fulvimonas soli]PWK81836.1 hexosaminidase [Fulvimonas soli]TNY25986.1 beta-hexosaminidase [Fulvimonas soli]